MATQLKHMIDTLDFNTVNVRLCLQDMENDDAFKRILGGNRNSLIYVVGHMIQMRYQMAKIAGANLSDEWQTKFAFGDKCNDGDDYPNLSEIREGWDNISENLIDRLKTLTDDEASADIPTAFPMHQKTVAGGLAFLTWHDSYHLGQVGTIRTILGYLPLKDVFHQNEK